MAVGGSEGEITLWDKGGTRTKTLKAGHGDIWSLGARKGILFAATNEGTIERWDEKGVHTSHPAHKRGIYELRVSADGSTLATCSHDRSVKLWDAQTLKERKTIATDAPVFGVAFSHDGTLLAMGNAKGEVTIYNAQTGTLVRTIEGHKSYVWSVDFAPKSNLLASGAYDKTVKFWDPTSGKQLFSYTKFGDDVNRVRFSPTSNTLASGSDDTKIMVWSMK